MSSRSITTVDYAITASRRQFLPALGRQAAITSDSIIPRQILSAGSGAAFAFPMTPPGSYRLPPIKAATGGAVLDEAGSRQDLLRDVLQGTVTVLALIY